MMLLLMFMCIWLGWLIDSVILVWWVVFVVVVRDCIVWMVLIGDGEVLVIFCNELLWIYFVIIRLLVWVCMMLSIWVILGLLIWLSCNVWDKVFWRMLLGRMFCGLMKVSVIWWFSVVLSVC